MLIVVIAIVMVIVILFFGWELFLDVQIIQRGLFLWQLMQHKPQFLVCLLPAT